MDAYKQELQKLKENCLVSAFLEAAADAVQKYIGTVVGEVGLNDMVLCRLEVELQNLDAPQSKVCGVVLDEMGS